MSAVYPIIPSNKRWDLEISLSPPTPPSVSPVKSLPFSLLKREKVPQKRRRGENVGEDEENFEKKQKKTVSSKLNIQRRSLKNDQKIKSRLHKLYFFIQPNLWSKKIGGYFFIRYLHYKKILTRGHICQSLIVIKLTNTTL